MRKGFKKVFKKERGVDSWIALILVLSFITLVIILNFDFRHEWNKKGLFNEVVLSVKDELQEEGGVTPYVESLIISSLSNAGLDTTDIIIEGSPQSNYGSRIYCLVTFNTQIEIGSELYDKTYEKKIVGTSAYIPKE